MSSTTVISNNQSISNVTNVPSSSSSPALQSDLFVTILTYVDYVNRILSMLIYITYAVFVLKYKFLRHKSLIYVHHSNLVGFLFCLMYIFYFGSSLPATSNSYANLVFCVMSEIIWSLLKYLRPYSILLIALYRLLAVFYIQLFKFFNRSYWLLLTPILLTWIFSGIVFVATKFGFHTIYGSLYCIDGLGRSLEETINYLIVTSVISILIPFVSITVIYLLIKHRLKVTENNLNKQNPEGKSFSARRYTPSFRDNQIEFTFREDSFMPNPNTAAVASSLGTFTKEPTVKQKRNELRKKKRLNQQLIAVMICYLMSFLVSFILQFRYIIQDFNQKFYYLRQILRILNVFFQSLIPVVSLYFNPHLGRMIRRAISKK